jgi:4'-phosphopantetheinyl transferase
MRDAMIVDLVLVDLKAVEPCRGSRAGSCLSEGERRRAHRTGDVRRRRRFVSAREALRHVVGAKCEVEPHAVRFAYGPFGKPEMMGRDCIVHFNVSHCEDVALIAVSTNGPVGVDVERVRNDFNLDRVVERLFSPEEARGFADLSPSRRPRALFTWWTRKESLVKATGEGLRSLRSFEVPAQPDSAARVLTIRGDSPGRRVWSLRDFAVGSDMVGAVAAAGCVDLTLRRRA